MAEELTKRWIVEERTYDNGKPTGWLALSSWDSETRARWQVIGIEHFGGVARYRDQFKREEN